MNLYNVVVETKRLRLVPISPKYREDIFAAFTEKVARYTCPQPTGDRADTDAFISASIERMSQGEELQFVALLKSTEEFIGCAGLHRIQEMPEPGLWLKESSWRNGFGFEIISALKDWADANIEYEYLYYPVKKENVASRRIAEKLDGVLENEEFDSKNAREVEHRMVAYRIYRA